MSFKLFIIYIALVFLRPVEQFFPEVMVARPMLVLWIFTFVTGYTTWKKSKLFGAHSVQIKLLLVLWLSIVLSLLFNGLFSEIPDAFGKFSTPAMLLFLVALNVTDIEKFKSTLLILIISINLLCLQSLYSYNTGYMLEDFVIKQLANENVPIPPGLVLPSDDLGGVYLWRIKSVGFLEDPNDFAQVICMLLPCLFIWYKKGALFSNVFKVFLPASIMLHTVNLSHSRGSLIGIVVILFVQVIRKVGVAWGGAMALAGGVGGMVILNQLGGRGFSAKEASANERLDAWFAGIEMFKSSPIFGVGYEQFTGHHVRTAHNSFVLCFAELGFLGYFCWIALIVLAFQGVVFVAKMKEPELQKIGWIMISALASFLSCAWFLSRTYGPTLYILLGLCFACYFAARRTGVDAKSSLLEQIPLPSNWVFGTFLCCGVSLIGVSIFVRAAT